MQGEMYSDQVHQTRQGNHIDRVRLSFFHVCTSGALCGLNMFDGSDYLTMSQICADFQYEEEHPYDLPPLTARDVETQRSLLL